MNPSEFLESVDDPALVEAICENAIDGCKQWRVWDGLTYHEEDQYSWTISDVPFPVFNNVLEARLDVEVVVPTIEAAKQRAGSRDVPMMWWTVPVSRPETLGSSLESGGFQLVAEPVGMAVDLNRLNGSSSAPEGLQIEEVTDDKGLQTWSIVMAEVFDFPDFARDAWNDMHRAMAADPNSSWRHFVGTIDGQTVATGSLFAGRRVASVASIGTLFEHRGQGIGSKLTASLFHKAAELGYRVGTLFSSEMAENTYRQLGFKEHFRGGCYVWNE